MLGPIKRPLIMGDFLTHEELLELTGTKQPSKQADVLTRNGIYFILRYDQLIKTTWYHVHHPLQHVPATEHGPNFSAFKT